MKQPKQLQSNLFLPRMPNQTKVRHVAPAIGMRLKDVCLVYTASWEQVHKKRKNKHVCSIQGEGILFVHKLAVSLFLSLVFI